MKHKAKWALIERNCNWFLPQKDLIKHDARIIIARNILKYVEKKRLDKIKKKEQLYINDIRLKIKQGLIKKKDLSQELRDKIGDMYPKAAAKKNVAKQGAKKRVEDKTKKSDSKEKKATETPKRTALKVST